MEERLIWKTSAKYSVLFDTFKSLYEMKQYITVPIESNKNEVDKKENKRCRFCNKSEPETSFDRHSHKISRFLGNHSWYAIDECDRCNTLFSKYETSLSDYFCLDRSIIRVQDSIKPSKFKSPAKRLYVESGDFYNKKGIYIKQAENSRGHFSYDEETGNLSITTKTTPYVPLYVYKALIKIALSLLPYEAAACYPALLSFLADPFAEGVPLCLVMVYSLHTEVRFNFQALLFERKDKGEKIPTHYFCFYWLNNIIVLYLPCHENDNLIATSATATFLPIPPPLFLNINDDTLNDLKINFFDQELSSLQLKKDAEREILFKIQPETLRGSITTNLETGIQYHTGEFDISKVTGLFISTDEEISTIYFNEAEA